MVSDKEMIEIASMVTHHPVLSEKLDEFVLSDKPIPMEFVLSDKPIPMPPLNRFPCSFSFSSRKFGREATLMVPNALV